MKQASSGEELSTVTNLVQTVMFAFSPPFIKKQMCGSTLLFSKGSLLGGTQTRFVSIWLVFFPLEARSGSGSGAHSSSVAQPHWRSLIFRLGHCLGIFGLNFTNNLLCKEFPVLPFCDLMPWVWFFWKSLQISIWRSWSAFADAVDGSGSWCS